MGGVKEDSPRKLLDMRKLVGGKQWYGKNYGAKKKSHKKKSPKLKKSLSVFVPTWKRLCNILELRYGNFILTYTVCS